MKTNGRINKLNRRQFMTAAAAFGSSGGMVLANLAPEVLALSQARVIFKSSFEKGQRQLTAPNHTLVSDVARTGVCSMRGEITAPNKACFLEVPFESKKGKMLHISYWVRSDKRSACATFVRVGKTRTPIGRRLDYIPANRWQHVQVNYNVNEDTRGFIQIVAPSSFNAPAGRAWIDDVEVVEVDDERRWPACVEDFGVLACDKAGAVWLAAIERPQPKGIVSVYRLKGAERQRVCSFSPPGHTAVFSPAIAPLDSGCIVAFAVEQDDRWRIAYAFIDGTSKDAALRYLDCRGNANISPALAVVGSRVCVLWESNADSHRGIGACFVDRKSAGPVAYISSATANSYNPSIVALPDGRLFAAWDSVRGKNADIYGAWFRDGTWQEASRITSDARIERHPFLAVHEGRVWMAWQAQSYPGLSINALRQQRIAVAKLGSGGLHAPKGLFRHVSRPDRLLMRPRIAFDDAGELWLTARQSMGPQAGWQAMLWRYSEDAWSQPQILMHQPGRWRPVELISTPDGLIWASQYDDLPGTWKERGIFRDWRSGIKIKSTTSGAVSKRQTLQTEPLKFPETDFSLTEKIEICSAELERQKWNRTGGELTLYWGDFHDHTDLSVCARSVNPPGHDLFANERDIERLDFCALTDHGYNFDPPQWAYNGAQTRNNYDPGRFVTFLAQEWTSSKNPPPPGSRVRRYGHRNLIFLDPYHKTFHDSDDGDISPAQVWKKLEGTEFICIPHQLADWKGKGGGNPPTDWSFVDERLQPVAEIWQTRQSYEYFGCPRQAPQGAPFKGYYLQDAWAKGIVIGVIASPDHGGGRGKVGVWGEELTREGIFKAVRARHTFGTSGAKMMLKFSSQAAMMGDKVTRPAGSIEFVIEALALRKIREMVVFRNNEIVFSVKPDTPEFVTRWTDKNPPKAKMLWYYVRVQAEDNELAWSSPIWFTVRR